VEHKLAAYRYYIERMLTLPLTKDGKLSEWKTILLTAQNNVPRKLLIRLKQQIKQKKKYPTIPK